MKKKEIMAMAAIGIVMVACSDNELHEHGNDWKGNEPLELSASISETVLSKADGNFTAGEYYFSYVSNTQTSLRYTDTKTDFDESGTGKSYLTWDKINTNSSLNNKLFILDNVPYQITNETTTSFTSSSNGKIDLSEIMENSEDITGSTSETTGEVEEEESEKSKYTAAPAPETPGTGNDLLWATVKVDDQIPLSPVHFELEHKMAMLTFDLYSKNDEIKEFLKEDVTVKLEGVITEPTTFNRVTGVVSVNYSTENISTINDMGVLEPTEDEEEGVARYTKSWIFPPQQFHKIGRPVLEVTLKNDGKTETKTFRGRLPESMIYNNKSELLEFISGCHLIIEVELGDVNNMEIRFRPVLVRKWIPKTIVDINVDQVGVRTAKELSDLVNTYNDNPNNPILWLYGVLKNNNGKSTWYFDLWSHISDYTEVSATDKNDLGFKTDQTPGFIINSHNYKVNGKTVNEYGNLKNEDTTTP